MKTTEANPYKRRWVDGVMTYVHWHVVTAIMRKSKPGWRRPVGSVVHHVNDIKADNRPCNLAVLQGHSEHRDLHYRRMVLRAGGNPWTDRICSNCGPQLASNFFIKSKWRRQQRRPRSQCKKCYGGKDKKVVDTVAVSH